MGGFPRKLFVTGLAHFSQPKGVGSVSQNERFVEAAGQQKIKEIRKVRYTEQLGGTGKKLRGKRRTATPAKHMAKIAKEFTVERIGAQKEWSVGKMYWLAYTSLRLNRRTVLNRVDTSS